MSTYIRTESGIYEVESITDEVMDLETGWTAEVYHLSDGNYKTNYDEFRLADNIEELCDYLFYKNREGELIIRKLPFDYGLVSIKSSLLAKQISDVKLAILTDKGLIYVAKMNKEGELELI